MNKIFNLAVALAVCIGFAACSTNDETEQPLPQPKPLVGGAQPITGKIRVLAGEVDYATANEYINIVEYIGSDELTDNDLVTFTHLHITGGVIDPVDVPFTTDGNILQIRKSGINESVKEAFQSMSDAPRDVNVKVLADVMMHGVDTVAKLETNSGIFNYKAKPLPSQAKEDAYYYIGNCSGWDLGNPIMMDANEDGTFSVILSVGDDEYFQFVPKSAVGGDWTNLLGCAVNGSEETHDFLVLDGEAMKIAKGGDYKFILDPLNFTYTVTSYVDLLWYAGDANGWSFSPLAKSNGKYVGYYWIDKADQSSTLGFKFPMADNWDGPQYGAGDGEWNIALGGGNIDLPAGYDSGFYMITVDLNENNFNLFPITSMSIIGTVNGDWDTDTDLQWDPDKKSWIGTADLKEGEFKIRANHDWTYSWGGELDALTADDGDKIPLAEAANYTVVFTPNCNGYGTLQLINNDDVLYYAGDANGWGHDPMQKVGDLYVGYYWIDAADNSSTWGFQFDTSPDWSKPQYGAGAGDWKIALGGGNITLPDNNPGFYKISVDLVDLSYSVSEISSISIIGTVNGSWDTDTYLAYDHNARAWVVTADFKSGEFKFRADHDWTISWGGELDGITSQNGANINLAEDGNYTISVAPRSDGNGICTITRN